MQIGEWHFKVRKTRDGSQFIAWCAKTPVLGDGPLDVDFNIETFFQFAPTPEEAIMALKREVLN